MMGGKSMAINAWLDEKLEKGEITKAELDKISSCSNLTSRIIDLCRLAEKTGDTTPVEILVGSLNNHNESTRIDSRRSHPGSGRPVPSC